MKDEEEWEAINISHCHGTTSDYHPLMSFKMVGLEKLLEACEDDNQVLTLGLVNEVENGEAKQTVIKLTKEQLDHRLDYFYKIVELQRKHRPPNKKIFDGIN